MQPYNQSIDRMQSVFDHWENQTYFFHFILNVLSVFINIFHIFIITRKSMRTSSVNVLMIGIAVCDLCLMLTSIYKYLQLVDWENPECTTANSLLKIYMDITAWSLQYHFRRCSCWLGILMASVRYAIMSQMSDVRYVKLAKPRLGAILIFIIFIVSAIITAVWQYECEVLENRTFPLAPHCAERQDINALYRFSVRLRPVSNISGYIINMSYFIIDSVISSFIPSIAFPTLTILLIRKIRKFKKATSTTTTNSTIGENDEKYGLTEKLIVLIAITFFIAEAPPGIISTIKAIVGNINDLYRLSTDLTVYFAILATINSILHPMFCLVMSSKYRKTIKSMLRKKKEASVVPVEIQMSCIALTPVM